MTVRLAQQRDQARYAHLDVHTNREFSFASSLPASPPWPTSSRVSRSSTRTCANPKSEPNAPGHADRQVSPGVQKVVSRRAHGSVQPLRRPRALTDFPGKLCIEVDPTKKIAVISEELCIGACSPPLLRCS